VEKQESKVNERNGDFWPIDTLLNQPVSTRRSH
jgi:hypothetical protein